MTPQEALEYVNVRAFLRAIRLGEGTADDDGYRRVVGGGHFADFADHPRKAVWIPRYRLTSTAAGAYQFLAGTWDEMRRQYRLPDFSPRSQDLGAVGLLIRRRALDDVLAGRIEDAVALCRLEWASLPGSPYGQRTESLDRVLGEYETHGGRFGLSVRLPVSPAGATPSADPVLPPIVPPGRPEPAPITTPENVAKGAPIEESEPVYEWQREGWLSWIIAFLASLRR